MGLETDPAQWLECKVPCADCPTVTTRTAKIGCQHLWRQLIRMELETSGDGTVSFATPERAAALGATVSSHDIGGNRPSVQITSVEPPARHGFQKARIAA